jgi:hypothetical protein
MRECEGHYQYLRMNLVKHQDWVLGMGVVLMSERIYVYIPRKASKNW